MVEVLVSTSNNFIHQRAFAGGLSSHQYFISLAFDCQVMSVYL